MPEPEIFLPISTTPGQAALWQDIPAAHWEDASMWIHRDQLKDRYDLSDRAYFRWMESLKEHGLTRSLPAKENRKFRLFYRFDLEQAIARLQAQVDAEPRRGRRFKALTTTNPIPSTTDPNTASQTDISSAPAPVPAHQPPIPARIMAATLDPTPAPQTSVAATVDIQAVAIEIAQMRTQQERLEGKVLNLTDKISLLQQQIDHMENLVDPEQQGRPVSTTQASAATTAPPSPIGEQLVLAFDALSRKLTRQISRLVAGQDGHGKKTASTRKPQARRPSTAHARAKQVEPRSSARAGAAQKSKSTKAKK